VAEKFLMLSGSGEGYGLALRLRQAGHLVAVNCRDTRTKDNYNGLLQKLDSAANWENYLDDKTIVLFDSSGGGKTADRLRARGHFTWAGSVFADQIELDRSLAFELLEQAGVRFPETKTFFDWEEGRKYARRVNTRLVFKASGELAKDSEVQTYSAYDTEDMIAMLDYFESAAKHSPEFELQRHVKGVAVSTEGWFNGEKFMEPFNHTIEHKAMMNDDLGPSTGCAFNVVWKCEHDHVVEQGIRLFEPILAEYGHIGPVDLNTIVNSEGVWALEFTPRMGYDAFPTILELVNEDLGELIAKMARGEQPERMELGHGFAAGLRLTVPPHPSEQFKPVAGIPVRGFTRTDREHLYFFDVMFDETNKLVTTSAYGNLLCATGKGRTIQEAFEGPSELVNKARIPEKQFRTDAVNQIYQDYNKLMELIGAEHNVLHEVGGNP
jgi:phosphoribosylamine-glycine ligase